MKKKLATIFMATVLASVTLTSAAQKNENQSNNYPKWLSKYGYWVIEKNISTPKNATILFYNNTNTLVYTEKVEGVKLNTRSKKTLMKLKQALEESLIAWKQQQPVEGQQLVTNILRSE